MITVRLLYKTSKIQCIVLFTKWLTMRDLEVLVPLNLMIFLCVSCSTGPEGHIYCDAGNSDKFQNRHSTQGITNPGTSFFQKKKRLRQCITHTQGIKIPGTSFFPKKKRLRQCITHTQGIKIPGTSCFQQKKRHISIYVYIQKERYRYINRKNQKITN